MANNQQDIYTTVTGDTWDLISYRVYGSEFYMDRLLAANPAQRETAVFGAGVAILCPDIELPVPDSLPPWRRG